MATIDYRLALALRAGAENAHKTAEGIRTDLKKLDEAGYARTPGMPDEEDAREWDKDATLIYAYLATFDREELA